jgi:16S rRNA G966 N2-methylase RsmD
MADNNSPYDIIYYDPPYSDDNLAILIPEIAACIAENGILVVEHDSKREAAQAGKLEKYSIKTRYYGDSAISYISR